MIDTRETIEAVLKSYYNAPPDALIDTLVAYVEHTECPHCGTTEMLCGHNGVGCEHDTSDN